MTTAMRRALAGGATALVVWALGSVTQIVAWCEPHRAWVRGRHAKSSIVVDRGERIVRPGDATYVCETTHTTGPVAWHQDLSCYCAPATMPLDEVARTVGGACTLDQLQPAVDRAIGRCLYARCSHYVDPE